MLITVIIPACGRPVELARCLRALPAGADVIVTDDSADDAVQQMLARDFPRARHLAGPRRGPAANRNHGARAATGDWLVFLDDDCIPQPGWLEAIAAHAEAKVVEGRTVCPDACDDPFTEQVENLNGNNFWSCNLAMQRSAFFDLGGFDEDFTEAAGEDMELAWRIRRHNLRSVFDPEAEVLHPARRASIARYWRRTWMIRWMALYRLKTGDAPPLGASRARIYGSAIRREVMDLLRLTAQLVTRPDPYRPSSQVFQVLHRWITFPLVLPWQLYWERRFRQQLSRKA